MNSVEKWLANGETGVSSKTMAFYLGFGIIPETNSHPHDPSDLLRCIKFLQHCPELRSKLHLMSEVSNTWEGLVRNWDRLESSLNEEMKLGSRAPKTYKMMKDIINMYESDWVEIAPGVRVKKEN